MMVAAGSLSDIRAYMPFQVFSDAYHVVLWDIRGCGLIEQSGHRLITEQWDALEGGSQCVLVRVFLSRAAP